MSKRNQIQRMPACPASPTGAHHWLLERPSHDAAGNYGSTGRCSCCGAEKFFVQFTAAQAHRAYGRLPKAS